MLLLANLLNRLRHRPLVETVRYRTRWTLRKFADDAAFAAGCAYDEITLEGNLMLNAGIGEMLDLLIAAGSPTAFNNANSYIGVGDSTTAEAAGQTDLQAATNKTRKAMSATYPSRSGQTVTWRSAFGSADANYAWQEFGVFNASTGGKMLNRKVSNQGTKASGQTWTVDLAITWS